MSRRHPGRGRPGTADIRAVRLLAELEIADRDLIAGDLFLWPVYEHVRQGLELRVQTWRIVEVLDSEVDAVLQRVLAEPVGARTRGAPIGMGDTGGRAR